MSNRSTTMRIRAFPPPVGMQPLLTLPRRPGYGGLASSSVSRQPYEPRRDFQRARLCAIAPQSGKTDTMTELLNISLPDGSVREMPAGSTPGDVAAAIGPGLAKAALAARVDGEVRDLNRPFDGDASLALITARDEADALELARHDYAHVLAEAVQSLWPDTQITFGPATDDGFYYDFAPGARG